ncbi:hypothetical protein INT43_001036 [Umbelopsis isabellina]|uniref:Scamp-domain-containing protein n=1 Tax=Mortierella isabellina TaxID=91625 RepID=A0A8H7UDE7_MORIS|nr:hypothetical protein INT43_001036 [Umbelopsis isabellina]
MSKPNPFDDPSNPFEDPSITSALTSHREEPAYQLETDPIHANSSSFAASTDDFSGATLKQFSAPEVDPFSSSDSPYQQSSTVSTPTPGALSGNREEELLRKERELEQRERDLEQRQQTITRQGRLPNNFPPCFPFIYLDINVEIPPQHQGVMNWLYREWLLFEITLVMNFIAILCVLFSHPPSVTSAPTDMGVALTEMFTHTAASFFLWYRPVYNAYMKDVSLYFFLYFVFNGFHILYTFYMAVGIPSTGGAGLILLVTLFSDGYILSGIFTLLATICWLVMGVMAIFLFKKTYDQYKAAGHTWKETKTDAYVHLGRSPTARNIAVQGAGAYASANRR